MPSLFGSSLKSRSDLPEDRIEKEEQVGSTRVELMRHRIFFGLKLSEQETQLRIEHAKVARHERQL
jgi:hypothetical protein